MDTNLTLMPHQQATYYHIVNNPKCAVWLDVGGGKTLTTLSALYYLRPAGHILLIAPKNIARSTWFDDIEKWGFPLRTKSLVFNERDNSYSRKKRLEKYQEVFTDPPTFYMMTVDLIHDLINEMPKKYGKILWPFNTIIIDEAQEFKNPSTRRFKALRKVAHASERIIELSGTPTPESLRDIWSQMYLLDGGAALEPTFTAFDEKYFRVTKTKNDQPIAWEPLPGAEDEIYRRINHLVISADNTAIPKPPVSHHLMSVKLEAKTLEQYHQFRKETIIELADPDPKNKDNIIIETANAGVLHMKLLQYASGTLYTGEDHTTEFTQIHDEKLQMTEYIIRNTGNSPIILAYRFVADRELLKKHLTKKGYHVEVFDGSREMVRRWNAGEIHVMLYQPASAQHGLNLQDGGHTLIWYTLPDSYSQFYQTQGRLARIGQKHPVDVYMIVTSRTRDAQQPKRLEEKSAGQERLLASARIEQEVIQEIKASDDYDDIVAAVHAKADAKAQAEDEPEAVHSPA